MITKGDKILYNILVCDDEKDIVSAVSIYLKAEGYQVFEANNGRQALEIVAKETVHLAILDLMMPEMDGLETLMVLRKKNSFPVILLTAKSEDADKILGLNLGADDYVTKPFNPIELIARVRSQLRRYIKFENGKIEESNNILSVGGIELDDNKKEVKVDGEICRLTKTEYDILKFMMVHPRKVFSPREIYTNVWNDIAIGTEGTVAVHIRHLREKIEINPSEPRYLKVVWARGYLFDEGGNL